MIILTPIIIWPVFTRKKMMRPEVLLYLKNAIRFNPEVRKWAENDSDLKVLADLPEFKKLLEKK